jgi:hypothetical protein
LPSHRSAVTDYNHLLRPDAILRVAARPSWPRAASLTPPAPHPGGVFLFAAFMNLIGENRSEFNGLLRCRISFENPTITTHPRPITIANMIAAVISTLTKPVCKSLTSTMLCGF